MCTFVIGFLVFPPATSLRLIKGKTTGSCAFALQCFPRVLNDETDSKDSLGLFVQIG